MFSTVRLVSACILVLQNAAFPRVSLAETPPEDSSTACEYLTFFVDTDGSHLAAADLKLRSALYAASEGLAESGLREVHDLSDASWLVRVNGYWLENGNLMTRVEVNPEGAIEHHIYVVLMDDPSFPYRGELGSAYAIESSGSQPTEGFAANVTEGVKEIWRLDAEQTLALCRTQAKLIREGWTAIEEIRKQLGLEMERVRRERSMEHQKKRLELEAEDAATP